MKPRNRDQNQSRRRSRMYIYNHVMSHSTRIRYSSVLSHMDIYTCAGASVLCSSNLRDLLPSEPLHHVGNVLSLPLQPRPERIAPHQLELTFARRALTSR